MDILSRRLGVIVNQEKTDASDSAVLRDKVFAAIVADRIGIARQKIVSARDGSAVLYDECLVRLIEQDGTVRTAEDIVPPLELAGCVAIFDLHVLKLVLDELEADPSAVLGWNVSADTLVQEWPGVRERILARPKLAARLVLELTESRPVPDIVRLSEMLLEIRSLGSKIAIDDFGSGYATPVHLVALTALIDVDIVKIDRAIMHDLRRGADGHSSLHYMVGLAACMAPMVVVEGVETLVHRAAAEAAGAAYAQGYLFAEPVLPGVWRDDRALSALHRELAEEA